MLYRVLATMQLRHIHAPAVCSVSSAAHQLFSTTPDCTCNHPLLSSTCPCPQQGPTPPTCELVAAQAHLHQRGGSCQAGPQRNQVTPRQGIVAQAQEPQLAPGPCRTTAAAAVGGGCGSPGGQGAAGGRTQRIAVQYQLLQAPPCPAPPSRCCCSRLRQGGPAGITQLALSCCEVCEGGSCSQEAAHSSCPSRVERAAAQVQGSQAPRSCQGWGQQGATHGALAAARLDGGAGQGQAGQAGQGSQGGTQRGGAAAVQPTAGDTGASCEVTQPSLVMWKPYVDSSRVMRCRISCAATAGTSTCCRAGMQVCTPNHMWHPPVHPPAVRECDAGKGAACHCCCQSCQGSLIQAAQCEALQPAPTARQARHQGAQGPWPHQLLDMQAPDAAVALEAWHGRHSR
jgi:hypothetical protein